MLASTVLAFSSIEAVFVIMGAVSLACIVATRVGASRGWVSKPARELGTRRGA